MTQSWDLSISRSSSEPPAARAKMHRAKQKASNWKLRFVCQMSRSQPLRDGNASNKEAIRRVSAGPCGSVVPTFPISPEMWTIGRLTTKSQTMRCPTTPKRDIANICVENDCQKPKQNPNKPTPTETPISKRRHTIVQALLGTEGSTTIIIASIWAAVQPLPRFHRGRALAVANSSK